MLHPNRGSFTPVLGKLAANAHNAVLKQWLTCSISSDAWPSSDASMPLNTAALADWLCRHSTRLQIRLTWRPRRPKAAVANYSKWLRQILGLYWVAGKSHLSAESRWQVGRWGDRPDLDFIRRLGAACLYTPGWKDDHGRSTIPDYNWRHRQQLDAQEGILPFDPVIYRNAHVRKDRALTIQTHMGPAECARFAIESKKYEIILWKTEQERNTGRNQSMTF
jgi:hypothetical protein